MPDVVFASDAPPVAASCDLEPEPPGDAPGRGRRAGRTARASPSATSGPSARARPSTSGTASVPRASTGSRPRPPRGRLAGSPGRRPRASSARRRRSGACPPSITPTLTVTPSQRPFRAWSRVTRSAAARIAERPFSGSTPACAARPWTVTRASRMPFRDETMSPLARAHSRTRQTSLSAAISRMCGVERRRADLLVRVRDVRQPLERQRRRRRRAPGARTARRAGPTSCRSRPGRGRSPSASIANGRSAAVPGSKTVSMWPMSRTAARLASRPARPRSR